MLEGVTKRYGAVTALRAVDLELEAGAVTVLEGPNGAGKSTLLAILGTLLRPSKGTVRYEPLGTDLARARTEIGWLAHESLCYPELTARENISLAARLHGVDPLGGWEAVAGRVDITGLRDRTVGTLSRGQRQRVALGRALVHRPAVLLLDEPATGLDAASVSRLESVVQEERDLGRLVVIVSHSAGMAARLADRIVRLERGRVVDR